MVPVVSICRDSSDVLKLDYALRSTVRYAVHLRPRPGVLVHRGP